MSTTVLREAGRIAVLRALKIGDMLCAVPALRALRAATPRAKITLIGLPWAREFAERYPYVDNFLEFPGWPGLPERNVDVASVPAFLAATRKKKFDVVLQLHGSGQHTNGLAALLGGRQLACFADADAWRPPGAVVVDWQPGESEARQLLRLVEALGAEPRGEHLEFPLSDEDHVAAAGFLHRHGLRAGKYVCVHPGASVPERRWPAERFAAVADALSHDGASVVITGSSEEAAIGDEVAAAMCIPPVNACGETPLGMLGALVEQAALVVSNDTAMSHIASAVRTPSVVVSRDPQTRRWAPPDATLHRVLSDLPAGAVTEHAVIPAARALMRPLERTPVLAGLSEVPA